MSRWEDEFGPDPEEFCWDYEDDREGPRSPDDWHDFCPSLDYDDEESWYWLGLDSPDEDERTFENDAPVFEPWGRRDNYDHDFIRARSHGKPATLRSWRNPKARGGSCSRKAIARKMDLRMPVKPIGPQPLYAIGAYGPF